MLLLFSFLLFEEVFVADLFSLLVPFSLLSDVPYPFDEELSYSLEFPFDVSESSSKDELPESAFFELVMEDVSKELSLAKSLLELDSTEEPPVSEPPFSLDPSISLIELESEDVVDATLLKDW